MPNNININDLRDSVPPASGDMAFEFDATSSDINASILPVRDSVRQTKIRLRDVSAEVVAHRIVDFCREHGDLITNLKLQKLLFYTQAWYLALHGTKLFPERFEAWPNGPVQPDVFNMFREFNARQIDWPAVELRVPKIVDSHIADVMEAYGRLSSFDLERLSMSEDPWIVARGGLDLEDPRRPLISEVIMKRFYKSKRNEQKK